MTPLGLASYDEEVLEVADFQRFGPTRHRIYGSSKPSTVKPTTHTRPRQQRKSARTFAIAILGLVLGLVVLAIAAKTLHYSARSTETRYFSQSVKIAKYGVSISHRVQQVAAVIAPHVRIEEPHQARLETALPIFPAVAPSKAGPKQLRSPPVSA